ncbi:unnamed protein product [Phyllotreta striolata]|uniref:Autophagy-related protein 9 n=1 Tax=Phyllotreta striolata TaxID=444603 RepID=A0A9N9THP7_PHYSR|nr:unnamed protein product [Phyllotreta striolata]
MDIIAFAVMILKFLTKFYQIIHFWDIKQFYNTALGIQDDDLDNLTWSDVMEKIKSAQLDIQMCIHKRELTELDIYHRILRQENYMVAMVNKHLFPPRFNVPFLGELVYWTKTLRYNIQALLFWSPWSPFESPWQLREEYKKQNLRNELATQLGRNILWLALINLCLAPIIFLWQVLYSFYSYGELIKREPGRMGMRNWSLYSKLYFRHFNELDHELHARLIRAYRPASEYLQAFNSPILTILAQYVGFICGSLFTVLVALTIYDEDVIAVESILTIMTVLGGLTALCRSFIPEETTVWCPEQLLECVVLHTHYLPGDWKGNAHKSRIRKKFQELFQMSILAIIDDMFAPLLVPFLMWWWVYPRSLEIVDFFRNFTVNVVGVGDVCSFAEMNIKKHGNPLWQLDSTKAAEDQYNQAEDGKVELSLVHFAATNPNWVPPPDEQEFIDSVQGEMEGTNTDALMFSGSVTNTEIERQLMNQNMDDFMKKKKADRSASDFISEPTSDDNLVEERDIPVTSGTSRGGKSVVWSTSIGQANQLGQPSFVALRDKKKSVAWLEGPDLSASAAMAKSTMVLQQRYAKSATMSRTSLHDDYQETTPLLSEKRPSR